MTMPESLIFLSSNTQDFIEVTSFKDKKSAEIATFLSSNTQDFIEVKLIEMLAVSRFNS